MGGALRMCALLRSPTWTVGPQEFFPHLDLGVLLGVPRRVAPSVFGRAGPGWVFPVGAQLVLEER